MKTIFTILVTVIFSLNVTAQDKGFVHIATAGNITSNWTIIDHPDLNGNSDARILFSQRYNGVDNNHPTGVWYTGSRWAIYNEDIAAMPVGAAFNVYIADDSPVAVHIADSSNTTGYYTELSGYTANDYLFYITYWNPHSVYNPYVYANQFWSGNRVLAVETLDNIPNNAAFFVMKGTNISAYLGSVASNSSNISDGRLTIDHPALNDNPNAVFLYSHYFGAGGNNGLLPVVTETEYNNSTGRWQIYAYGIGFPEGVWLDLIIPDMILGTNEMQAEVSKITLYPNPVVNNVNISSSKKEIQEVQIYDVSGKQVKTFMQTGKTITLDVSALQFGTYIAKIKTDEGWFSQKLIKK